jgi:stage IV sporulation protein B
MPQTIAVKGENLKISEIQVIPVGRIVGIKLYTNGVLVVGTSAIQGENGMIYKPFEKTEIKEGDLIISVNENNVNNTKELTDLINKSNGSELRIKYKNGEKEKECTIKPIKDENYEYKIGLWVRDSAGGVGTVTFYSEKNQSFAALGHAITDIDTGNVIRISSGEIDKVDVVSIVKGKTQEPGRIQGTIKFNSLIGNIYKNTEYGIYGNIKNILNLEMLNTKKMYVAPRQEIEIGEAAILSDVDGELKEYKIEIQRTYLNNNYDNKSMLIKVTDEELIKRTGGIIQGMSGSPIIQNGKLVGAVTHVLINEPARGYGIFIENMLK